MIHSKQATLRTCRRAERVPEHAVQSNKPQTQNFKLYYEEICARFSGYLPLIDKETAAKRGGGGGGARVIVLLGAKASKTCAFFLFFFSKMTHKEDKTKECV